MAISSEHMTSQRFSESLFMRIPLKVFGGFGKFGRLKLLISTEFMSSRWESEFSKASAVIPANEPASLTINRLWQKPARANQNEESSARISPSDNFPEMEENSSNSLFKFQVLGCCQKKMNKIKKETKMANVIANSIISCKYLCWINICYYYFINRRLHVPARNIFADAIRSVVIWS